MGGNALMIDSSQTRRPEQGRIVSAVIRVRNAGAELDRCLSSLGCQVLPDGVELEMIVVDNDSTDDSRGVAQRHGAVIVPISASRVLLGPGAKPGDCTGTR